MAIGMGLAIGGIASLASGVLGADASRSAANTQADAARNATAVQQQQFNQTSQNLAPWLQGGMGANDILMQLLGITPGTPGTPAGPATPGTPGNYLNNGPYDRGGQLQGTYVPGTPGSPGTPAVPSTPASFNPNAPLSHQFSLADFQASPAYNFNLDQGMQAINKGANARGNFYAPQTLQDLSKFAQGTASNEFQNAFSNYNTNQNNLFTRLQSLSGSGQNAAVQQGGFGAGVAGQIGSNLIGAGNAQAAGIVGQANALGNAGAGIYNAAIMQQILGQQQNGLYGNGTFPNALAGVQNGQSTTYDSGIIRN